MTRLTRLEQEGPVTVLTLARAERHNSLVPDLLSEIEQQVRAAETHADVRALVLRADGASFSTGGDLNGFLEHWDRDIQAYASEVVGGLNRAILALRGSPLPVVAAVQGWVTGGSLGFLLASDIVVAAAGARIAPFYCEVGFAPDGGWSTLLPDLVGGKVAVGAQMTNEVWSATRAVELGLANRLVSDERLDSEAMALAGEIAAKHPSTVRATKANRAAMADWEAALEQERRGFVATIVQPGVREGVEAFLDTAQRAGGQRG